MKILFGFNFYFYFILTVLIKYIRIKEKKLVILLSFDGLSLYIEYFGGLTTRRIVTESVPFLLKYVDE